jgi:hypothetical protein
MINIIMNMIWIAFLIEFWLFFVFLIFVIRTDKEIFWKLWFTCLILCLLKLLIILTMTMISNYI